MTRLVERNWLCGTAAFSPQSDVIFPRDLPCATSGGREYPVTLFYPGFHIPPGGGKRCRGGSIHVAKKTITVTDTEIFIDNKVVCLDLLNKRTEIIKGFRRAI